MPRRAHRHAPTLPLLAAVLLVAAAAAGLPRSACADQSAVPAAAATAVAPATLAATPPPVPLPATPPERRGVLSAASLSAPGANEEGEEPALYQGPAGIRPAPRPDGRPLRLYRNPKVDGLMRFFLERRRDVLERGWRRSGRYLPMIRRIFRAEGVPAELAYLAAVESNFNPHARSPARAVGMWQFTAPTARRFGLRRMGSWYDERLDPVSSTHAAARLLAYLYDRYESWELALAAYNAGEARVNAALERARRRGEPADYWRLRLPRQTKGFVPAFLAVAAIMESPAEHGLSVEEREPELAGDGVELRVASTLAELAGRLGLAPAELVQRNPAWRTGVVPPLATEVVLLWVPPGEGPRLLASLARQPLAPLPWLRVTVQEGDSVSTIAQRYGVTTRDVLTLNGLRGSGRLAIGQGLLLPVPADAPRVQAQPAAAGSEPAPPVPAVAQLRLHRVQSGESLWSIAQRYGVRMTELRAWNRLAGPVLRPEQELVVYLPKDLTAAQ